MNRAISPTAGLELLVFQLGDLRLALELTVVREVARAVEILPLPGAPPIVEGIIDVRGEIVPVYDVRQRFGLAPAGLHPDQRLVIAWTGERLVALRCDSTEWIEAVVGVADAEPLLRGRALIEGVGRLPDGLVLIQDLPAFLDAAEQEALDAALQARTDGTD
jgi:purine-binding chemotaxis protein CheW